METEEFTLSEEDLVAMRAADTAMMEHERAEEAKRQSVLAEVRGIVSAEVYAAIQEELADSGFTFDYQIAGTPIGQEQDEEAPWGKHFVNQTTNGGYSGDDYEGTVSIPLVDGRFFQFGYSM